MEITTAEAALRLGVSQRQVQRLVAAGRITPIRRVGRTLLVDATDMLALRAANRASGRPWTAPVAWAALWELSGIDMDWLDVQSSRRLWQRMNGISVDGLLWMCRHRAKIARYRASASFLDSLRERVRLTGASALDPSRDLLASASGVDGYCTPTECDAVVSEYFLADDPVGNVILRVTDFPAVTAWKGQMPDAVVYADLAESTDPRQRAIGHERLEGILQ